MEIFDFGFSMGTAPKYTTDDIMAKLDTEFVAVKNQLKEIYAKLAVAQVQNYQSAEEAVSASVNDMKFNSSYSIDIRAPILYDKIQYFLNGMLGNIVAATRLPSSRQHCIV